MSDEEVERLAHHTWHAKEVLSAQRAIPRLLRAAELSERQRAYDQVEVWLRRGIRLVDIAPPHQAATAHQEQQLHIRLGQTLAITRGYGDRNAEAALRRGHRRLGVGREDSTAWGDAGG
ncbi:hypothetical protein AB0451_23955 [Streptomyces sp. NPDC052000]|uniref:hypothetical protein n=1 Tax=Streptomyces sp. NPDC052000 TaxID=3155676 RepID=UPI00344D3AAB